MVKRNYSPLFGVIDLTSVQLPIPRLVTAATWETATFKHTVLDIRRSYFYQTNKYIIKQNKQTKNTAYAQVCVSYPEAIQSVWLQLLHLSVGCGAPL